MYLYLEHLDYLCNIQTTSRAKIRQIFVLENIFNQKVTNMEEKKINEAQAAEQTTSQENVNEQVNEMTELEILKGENDRLQKQYESEKKSCLRYYRQMNMLKQAITKLTEEGKITEEDVVKAVLAGQDLMSLEDLLFTLAD